MTSSGQASSTETSKGRARLFIAQDRLDVFRSTLSNSTANGIETRKFTVTQDFLYGQANPEGKDRFLVLHDKERNPFQVCAKSEQRNKLTACGSLIYSLVDSIASYPHSTSSLVRDR